MKRQRTSSSYIARGAKRPIDKNLIAISQSVTTAQTSTDLLTATFPATVTGLRWSMNIRGSTTAHQLVSWAIVIVKDGLSASTISQSDGAAMYQPEQNVLAFGSVATLDSDAGTGNGSYNWEGSTKSMRKLMGGDKLVLIAKANANTATYAGVVQFFTKS